MLRRSTPRIGGKQAAREAWEAAFVERNEAHNALLAALADPVRLPEPEQRQAISDALNDDGTDPVAFQAALDEFLPEKGEPADG
jgi:hypothetical protein